MIQTILTHRQVLGYEQLMEDLGDTPDEVADCLRAKGIRGVRNTARILNPVVRYLHELMPEAMDIDVTERDHLTAFFPNGEEVKVRLSPAVQQFLDAFDAGEHPDLESPLW